MSTTTTTTNRFIASGAEDSFNEEDSGVLVRCTNRLVRNHRTVRGGAMTRRTLESGLRDYEDDSIFDRIINQA